MRKTTLNSILVAALIGQVVTGTVLAQTPGAQPASQAPQAPPTPQQRVDALKQWLAYSEKQLRAYEWVETTVITLDGSEKSRTVKRCYYGVDGKLQKVVLQATPEQGGGPPGPLGALMKKAAENKKQEMAAYMKKAADLVHQYIPPVPGFIQQSIANGKMGMQMLEPNRRVRLTFGDFLKPGDSLGVEMELPSNRLLAMAVTSYLDTTADAVALNVSMGVLPDGTIFAGRTQLDAKAKGLIVTVENSGHRRVAQ